jgi:hypothetical protein
LSRSIKILTSNILKDTKDNLLILDYIVPENILIIESDTNKRKMSDGINLYPDLEYIKDLQVINIDKEYIGSSSPLFSKACSFRNIIDNGYEITDAMVSKQTLTIYNVSNTDILNFKFTYEENSDVYGDTLEISSNITIPLYKKYWELYMNGNYKINISLEIIGIF